MDVTRALAWRGCFVQPGVNVTRNRGDWTLRCGLLRYLVRCGGVDDILAGRGNAVHWRDRTPTPKAAVRFAGGLSAAVRAQLSCNLLLSDL